MTDQPLSAPSEDAPQPPSAGPQTEAPCEHMGGFGDEADICMWCKAVIPAPRPSAADAGSGEPQHVPDNPEPEMPPEPLEVAADRFIDRVLGTVEQQAQEIATLRAALARVEQERANAIDVLRQIQDERADVIKAERAAERDSAQAQIAALTTRAEQVFNAGYRAALDACGFTAEDVPGTAYAAYLAQPAAAAGTGETPEAQE